MHERFFFKKIKMQSVYQHLSMSVNLMFHLDNMAFFFMKGRDMGWILAQIGVRGWRRESPFQGEKQKQQQKQLCSPTAALTSRALIKPTCLSQKHKHNHTMWPTQWTPVHNGCLVKKNKTFYQYLRSLRRAVGIFHPLSQKARHEDDIFPLSLLRHQCAMTNQW